MVGAWAQLLMRRLTFVGESTAPMKDPTALTLREIYKMVMC